MRPSHRWYWTSGLLVAIGFTTSAYLLGRVFALLDPSRHAALDICSALFSTSCDGALTDPRAWPLSVPLAGWGVVLFSLLAALLALARFVEGDFETRALIAASALAVAGAVAGLTITCVALVAGEPVCPMCLSVHATSLAL